MFDVVLLTEDRYDRPQKVNDYIRNILLEAQLLQQELEQLNLRVHRTSWSNPDYNWKQVRSIVFRTTWDYFDRYIEFKKWIDSIKDHVTLINSFEIIDWNMNKRYLRDLEKQGIRITPTRFIQKKEHISLHQIFDEISEDEIIIKPVIGGAARNTHRIHVDSIHSNETLFQKLKNEEDMMAQPFLKNILSFGEISLMIFDGRYSHAVIKKAKKGDYRVQDDFGGTVEIYQADASEIKFAEDVIAACKYNPVYGRVDITYDNKNQLCVMELELVEPELWLRLDDKAPKLLAEALKKRLEFF